MEHKTNPSTIILTVIVTALVVGSGLYYWQSQDSSPVVETTTQHAAEYNCEQSGGSYSNGSCNCSDGEYEESTGYCITAFGTPGGALHEEAVKLQELKAIQATELSNKPVITYPANGSTVDGATIKGTAEPNTEIWAYVNNSENERSCITSNSFANGGSEMVDANGNFELTLAQPCSKELAVVVSAEDPTADTTGACRDSENVSEPITFTNSGELPEICSQ